MEGCSTVAEPDDINMFAGKLFTHRLDARSTIPNTDGDRIDLCVNAADGHLAAIARFAADRIDRDDLFPEFRDFLLKQTLDQLRACSAEHNADTVTRCTHLKHNRADSFAGMQRLAGYLLTARQDRFDIA